jgi:hypothetical protein
MGNHLEGELTAVEARLAALEKRTAQGERQLTATEQRLVNAESLIVMNGKRISRIEHAAGPARGTYYDATTDDDAALQADIQQKLHLHEVLLEMQAARLVELEKRVLPRHEVYDVDGGSDTAEEDEED